MTRRIALRWAALFLATSPILAETPTVRYVDFETMLNPLTAWRVEKAIEDAAAAGDELVLIRLDTPGGLVASMETIVKSILDSKRPVVVWVGPPGAKAASAGFFVLLAADIAAMSPGTRTGAAATIEAGGENRTDDVLLKKMNEDNAALLRSIADRRGRNKELSQQAIFEARAYEETVALEQGLIDMIVADRDDLLARLDGYEVTRFDGSKVLLHTAGARIVTSEFSFRHEFMEGLAQPWVASLLLLFGLLGIYVEFTHPGVVFPGVAGALCLLLFALSATVLPVSVIGILLILLALIMFVLEVKVPSYGMLTVGGAISLLIGSLMLIDGPIPEMRVQLALVLPVALLVVMLCAGAATLAARAQRERVRTGAEGLIGELGQVTVPLDPQGKVFVHGEIWNAKSRDAPIPSGERVRVLKVESMLLTVERVAGASAGGS